MVSTCPIVLIRICEARGSWVWTGLSEKDCSGSHLKFSKSFHQILVRLPLALGADPHLLFCGHVDHEFGGPSLCLAVLHLATAEDRFSWGGGCCCYWGSMRTTRTSITRTRAQGQIREAKRRRRKIEKVRARFKELSPRQSISFSL